MSLPSIPSSFLKLSQSQGCCLRQFAPRDWNTRAEGVWTAVNVDLEENFFFLFPLKFSSSSDTEWLIGCLTSRGILPSQQFLFSSFILMIIFTFSYKKKVGKNNIEWQYQLYPSLLLLLWPIIWHRQLEEGFILAVWYSPSCEGRQEHEVVGHIAPTNRESKASVQLPPCPMFINYGTPAVG